MPTSFRILLVDDFEPFRRTVVSLLQQQAELKIVGEAEDGPEALQEATKLQPDLVLLDIGLPKMNGIEVARKIQELSPSSKILFVSQESSPDLVQAAFAAGADGYVLKIDVGSELLSAVKRVLDGGKFLGRRFSGPDVT